MFRAAILTALFALPVAAQELGCENAMAQQEMNACAEKAWEAADAGLNDAYNVALAAMKEMDANMPEDLQGAEAALRAAERAWLAYRDANCVVAGLPMHGGSAEPLLIYGCMESMTLDRTAELGEMTAY